MSVENEVGRLSDILAIQQTISLYSLGQDSHQGDDSAILEQWDETFTSDGTTDYSVSGAPVCSYQELAEWMRGDGEQPGRMSVFSGWQHMLSIPVITLKGDTAEARTDFMAVHQVKTEGDNGQRFDAAGAFHDSLVRTDQGWRIKHRRLELYFADGIPTVSKQD